VESRQSTSIALAVSALLEREERLVLAVSGGVDSMTLLDAVARARPTGHHVVVATFDHGTGGAARAAATLVASESRARRLRVVTGAAQLAGASEAGWRAARLRFLRQAAEHEGARLVTAHTRDDHLETVVMRVLRGTGVRGLAALLAPSRIARPFLATTRAMIDQYAVEHRLAFVSDPSNRSRAHFRNRVRLDLLPAIRALRPEFESEMLDLADRALEVREDLDRLVSSTITARGPADVDLGALQELDEPQLQLVWPAIAARFGITLDRRGTARLARFSTTGTTGRRIQISGGIEVVRGRSGLIFTRNTPPLAHGEVPVVLSGDLRYGRYSFERVEATTVRARPTDRWVAALPLGTTLEVRPWLPGDRMRTTERGPARRVKRLFAEAQVAGPLRRGWPVVLAGGEIVWIPGIRRRRGVGSEERNVVIYRCERHSR
jgi:tRNA(Ile)-lysidine synthase